MIPRFKKPQSLFSPASALLREIDEAIATLYRDNLLTGVRPRFSMSLIGLADHGPLTIRDLADFTGVTHAAMSQSVKVMRSAGLVETETGKDARSVIIRLSDKGRSVVPFLEAEWDATEAMLAELDAELPYPLTKVVADIREKLTAEPMRDRLNRHIRKAQSD